MFVLIASTMAITAVAVYFIGRTHHQPEPPKLAPPLDEASEPLGHVYDLLNKIVLRAAVASAKGDEALARAILADLELLAGAVDRASKAERFASRSYSEVVGGDEDGSSLA